MVNVSKLVMDKNYLKNVQKNVNNNVLISKYYQKLAFEFTNKEREKFFNKADAVSNCYSVWNSIHYKKLDIKDFQKTWLCRDYKNCNNCKKVLQAARSLKWEKELEKFDGNLYHVIFTVPSCSGDDLRDTIKNMESAFKKFINYISLQKGSIIKNLSSGTGFKNINLKSFNYKGCLRSLEITWYFDYITGQYMFHPHFHCAFVFSVDDIGEKFILRDKNIKIDPYSFKRNDSKLYPYNVQEELFQRLWYLCYKSVIDDVEVNLNNILRVCDVRRKLNDPLMGKFKNVGYSVKIIEFKLGQYAELFKYMVKTVDFEHNKITYDVFKSLYFGLYKIKQLQGFGCLYNINDDVQDMEDVVSDIYINVINEIKSIDKGIHVSESMEDVVNSNSVYISKRKIYSYLVKEHKAEIKKNNKINDKVYKLGNKVFKSKEEMFSAAYIIYKDELKNDLEVKKKSDFKDRINMFEKKDNLLQCTEQIIHL